MNTRSQLDHGHRVCIPGTARVDLTLPVESSVYASILLASCVATDPETGRQFVQPSRDLGDPLADLSATMPYVEAQQLLDADYPSGARYYWKSLHLPQISDEAIELARLWSATRPSVLSTLDI